MNTHIKKIANWLHTHPQAKEWGWFIALWLGGLATVSVLAYPIKWVIKTFM